jgi:hypothetical protein
VKDTFIKALGIALLFAMYIMILLIVQSKIYAKIDINKFRSKVYNLKGNIDLLYMDFFYITTATNIQVNSTEP